MSQTIVNFGFGELGFRYCLGFSRLFPPVAGFRCGGRRDPAVAGSAWDLRFNFIILI
jgi:hypothetical protein